MAKIFITGSADGLGKLSANLLIKQGHEVVVHARNAQRGREAVKEISGASGLVIGDLTNMEETKELADHVNSLGSFDSIIHNAGVYERPGTEIFSVNTLAPYILTSLIQKPKRLIYLTSGMHMHGRANLKFFTSGVNNITYSDSKLHVLMLSMAIAEKWKDVYSNVVDPGWVPTRMGGKGAPDDLQKGYETQCWLAVSEDETATVSGRFFHHQTVKRYNREADDPNLRRQFISLCEDITQIPFPKT